MHVYGLGCSFKAWCSLICGLSHNERRAATKTNFILMQFWCYTTGHRFHRNGREWRSIVCVCLSPCVLLQSGVFSDVWYLLHVVEGLGRIKKREAGVEAMFQEFVSFRSGPFISQSHAVFRFVCVLCTHSRDVCCL